MGASLCLSGPSWPQAAISSSPLDSLIVQTLPFWIRTDLQQWLNAKAAGLFRSRSNFYSIRGGKELQPHLDLFDTRGP